MVVFTVVLGLAYPLTITVVAEWIMPAHANGSLSYVDGHAVGSSLIGQEFSDAAGNPLPQWFQPRPSAAGTGYDALSSGASNLGPNNPVLVSEVNQRRAEIAAFNHVSPSAVPPDALTASGSGLDPDISPAYAYLQVARVAAARHVSIAAVHALVSEHIQGREFGILGEPVVNVLTLNLALSRLGSS
jgi:K+-transporting ATPase ATPase C chain